MSKNALSLINHNECTSLVSKWLYLTNLPGKKERRMDAWKKGLKNSKFIKNSKTLDRVYKKKREKLCHLGDFFTKDGKLLWPELASGASGASLSTWLSRYSLLLHASACVWLNTCTHTHSPTSFCTPVHVSV